MAKARKSKTTDDSKQENSGAAVRHQKLCLSVDFDTRKIYGYTELEIVVPDIGIVGLHAENLDIVRVLVDGESADFEYYPHLQNADSERWSNVMSSSSAADIASSLYLSTLEKELTPNLLINCCKVFKVENEIQEPSVENGSHSTAEPKQNVKVIHIDYWIEKADVGIHFHDNVLHTDNQIRRARCWFPCIDENSQRCCYDLNFTVAHNLVAVSTGNLLYQVLSKDDPPQKTYAYRVDIPVCASWISLAVAPFQVLPDLQSPLLSHFSLPENTIKLRNTVGFFYTAFSYYEEYLGAKFPFGSYKQVFIAPEMAVSSVSLGASMSIFSSHMLYDEKIIDKTIDTRIKLAYALARQWFGVYISPASPDDEWLLDGLAVYLTDSYIKKHLGNNEARYQRFKANCAVCKADDSGATTLSSSASCKDLLGTQSIGLYGKIRSWKSVAILQMLEKQMGPESFCKVLQTIILRGSDANASSRTLSTKEFRRLAREVGNLERPFLKEFFPRWVGSCGCPVLRMGFSYNKRKNMIEVAVLRGCTARPEVDAPANVNADSETQETDIGWPGMMSIRVNELDGMYDHPVLPMAGEILQLLEIQCHSKLAARRFQKPKKGSKADGSDDNGDVAPDSRSSSDSPLLWVRSDPEMEYLAEIHLNQPVQMWINQLEKDKDVVAQSQAISVLEHFPHISFSVVNALNNFLCDSKAFWRVRVEAAYALANTSSEETDWAGLLHLMKFYKGRRFDATIGLPKPNDFRDIPEYFVLEAIPRAVAMVRTADGKSPREAVEFVLQLLKYNDNNGNIYSDVFWLAALIESIGKLEFGQQSILLLSSLLKRVDRLIQFDRLMPSYNGILTISCIRTLSQLALKFSEFIPLDRVVELIKPFRDNKKVGQIRIEASRALLDLEFQYKGLEATLSLFIKYLEEEPSPRGQVKLGMHTMRLCQMQGSSDSKDDIDSSILISLLDLLDSRMAFNNVFLRHHLFCILQIFAGRLPTLHGVPRDKTLHIGDGDAGAEQRSIFGAFVPEMKQPHLELPPEEAPILSASAVPVAVKEPDTVSSSQEQRQKKPIVKIKVKRSTASSRGDEDIDNQTVEKSQGCRTNEPDHGVSSSLSVDAPLRNATETVSIGNNHNNLEEVNSCHDLGSRVTASIGSAKVASEDLRKELQCTADSSKISYHSHIQDRTSQGMLEESSLNLASDVAAYPNLPTASAVGNHDNNSVAGEGSLRTVKDREKEKKKKKKDKDEKRKRDDPEYLERKRLKKEKKRKEKEMSKLLSEEKRMPVVELPGKIPEAKLVMVQMAKTVEAGNSGAVVTRVDPSPEGSGTAKAGRIRIKIKNKPLNKS
ncbi:hypothetical protein SAY87_026455 [Trapa incisa]|uniref:Transcription initiation factor TFIID subunit 2 n=1 Tax=Trapa incisa TaxID=236973 RepID=A0AAN7GLX0_9MYRT|nr:hypothetical protein SAY87_026455 [Trapa incisa]